MAGYKSKGIVPFFLFFFVVFAPTELCFPNYSDNNAVFILVELAKIYAVYLVFSSLFNLI